MREVFRKCSTCKKDILIGDAYQICSVSTCKAKATNYAFCSVVCWDAHLPIERHRSESAYALERRASKADAEAYKNRDQKGSDERKRIVVTTEKKPHTPTELTSTVEDEILVVVSKVRKYISDISGMNTSAGVYEVLTEKIKKICQQGIEEARKQGRKTVLDRDIP